MIKMKGYSITENLYCTALTIFNPKRLIERELKLSSLLYGIIPFIIYIIACEIGWMNAFSSPVSPDLMLSPKKFHLASRELSASK